MHAATGRPANDHGCRRVPKIVPLGDKIGDLVEGADDEIDELHFGDGTQAEIAHAASRADDGGFADGSIHDAFPAEAFEQAFAGLERAAVDADVFADQHHRGVAFHFFVHGLFYGFEKSDLRCFREPGTGFFDRRSHGYLPAFLAAGLPETIAGLPDFFCAGLFSALALTAALGGILAAGLDGTFAATFAV